MKAQKLLDKLESYEQEAYDAAMGTDWLEAIGEGFKFYVRQCVEQGESVTMAGFVKYVDAMAREKLEVSE
ncbi:hypothetical protein ACLBWT_14905 [Paenibacillus sp. D51F]